MTAQSKQKSPKIKRLRSASLYVVIIIALIVALLCEAMIATAYYYRTFHQYRERKSRLDNHTFSGLQLIRSDPSKVDYEDKAAALTSDDRDTIRISKYLWGAFDVGVSKASSGKDSSVMSILMGLPIDSAKAGALYLVDEDRPLSVSGNTRINGNVFLPKSGIRTAYFNNAGYEGSPGLFKGTRKDSQRELPGPDLSRITALDHLADEERGGRLPETDTLLVSFSGKAAEFRAKERSTLMHKYFKGRIIVRCDSVLTVDSTTTLEDVTVFARAIVIRPGFKGRCQLFARDSIVIGDRCELRYPSVALLNGKARAMQGPGGFIRFGSKCHFTGLAMVWDKERVQSPSAIYLGAAGIYSGQYYGALIGIPENTTVIGQVMCRRFYLRSGFGLYENYLVNARLDADALSPFYLGSSLVPVVRSGTQNIIRWLE
ncbi:hypothetical protein [Mucilaginibacter sp. 44-25]|mgnify:CR=1 FL=1|uniref:hypothetical protein n=1 Tax=Mucilaginibacter sp. 44-25 TaxID=1895794 RepID=UPI0025CD5F2B|nr:hypothetical protein [Mucilaginibacter sp. 44-25]